MVNNKIIWADVEKNFGEKEGLPFKEYLSEKEIRETLEEEKIKYRIRIFSPMITIWAFLSQVQEGDKSCRFITARVLSYLVTQGKVICSITESAYCHAKKRLRTSVLSKLTKKVAKKAESNAPREMLWCGRKVKTYDGSSLRLECTEKNEKAFPQSVVCKKGCGFPVARWTVLFCLTTGVVLEMYLEPMKISERVLFRKFYQTFSAGDVALADRGGCSFGDFALLAAIGVDAIFRMNRRKFNFEDGYRLGKKDHIVAWQRPEFRPQYNALSREQYNNFPDEIYIRELDVTVVRKGYRTKKMIICTTLLDPNLYTKKDLQELYLRRWEAELNIRHLKTSLKMSTMKSKTPRMFYKEVWAHLLFYNLIRSTMLKATLNSGLHSLRISFKGTVDRISAFLPSFASADSHQKQTLLFVLFLNIAEDIVPRRDRPPYKRCVKRRRKFPLMGISRSDFRLSLGF